MDNILRESTRIEAKKDLGSKTENKTLCLTPGTLLASLHFKGPYNIPVTRHITLVNSRDYPIVFKFLTTVQTRYGVTPNKGIIQPGKSVVIRIRLYPLFRGAKESKRKHRFKILWFNAGRKGQTIENVIASTNPKDIRDTKINCHFDEVTAASSNAAPSSNAPSSSTLHLKKNRVGLF